MVNLKKNYSISIIGSGKIGQAVGHLLLLAGHSVCFGSRSPEKLSNFIEKMGERASVKSLQEAASESEIVFLALPYSVVDEVVLSLEPFLNDKIVVDATNPFTLSSDGHIISSLKNNITAGEHMSLLLPNSIVIRAFSHIMDELLVSRGTTQSGLWAVAIAGDNLLAKKIVSKLVEDTGFVPVDIGTLANSSALDPGGKLFPHMFTQADMKDILFK